MTDSMTRKEELALRQRRNDTEWLLKQPQGCRFLARLLDDCGLLQASWRADERSSSFAEGRRSVALGVVSDITEIDRHAFLNLQIALAQDRASQD